MRKSSKRVEKNFFVEINPNPVVEVDGFLAIQYLNPAARSHFSDLEELGCQHPVLQELSALAEQLKRQREGLITFVREIEIEGKIFEEQIFALPKKGRIYLYLVDISERKQAELELKNSETQLQNANIQLGELLVVKDQVMGNVTHELRTPLAAMKEGVSLLRDGILGSLNEKQLHFLDLVDRNCQRLMGLIEKVLELSKIRSGKMPLFRRRLQLAMIIEKTLEDLKVILSGRVVQFKSSPVPNVFADPERVSEVLVNLITNALKFTKENDAITCTCSQKGAFVAVTVEDAGVGMAEEDLKKLFERFSQVGEYKAGGTGLGLSICKEIVALHKGEITVASEPGKGSSFTFTLPVYTPQLVLEESFQALYEASLKRGGSPTIGLITLDGEQFFSDFPKKNRLELLDQLVEFLRLHTKSGDNVLVLEPHWVVILANAEVQGIAAMVWRVRGLLKDWAAFQGVVPTQAAPMGMAIYPTDGQDVQTLFDQSREFLAITRIQSAHPKKSQILLADDEPDVLEVTKMRLEALGFEVLTAVDGQEVLEVLSKDNSVGLLLMDIKMSQMDGFQVAQQLAANPAASQIPIIGFTAYARELGEKCKELGIICLLEKPFSFQKLYETIQQTFEKGSVPHA